MISRRSLLKTAVLGGGAALWGRPWGVVASLATPLTGSGRLDTRALAREVERVEGCGARGVVWPAEWNKLSAVERMAGAEVVMAVATGRVILGVAGGDIESTRRYARQAERISPDAILCAPLSDPVGHYRAAAEACGLPLMAHSSGGMSIEFVLRMRDEISTLRLVKDEGEHTLSRISEYRRVAPDLAIFTGGRGRTLPDEWERGASGVIAQSCLVERFVRIWEYCRAGKREEAIAELSRMVVERA